MRRRTDPDQLDFFAKLDRPASPHTADLVIFPANRMIGAMREIAATLLKLPNERDRDRRWKIYIYALRERLQANGIPDHEIDPQLRSFRAGVICQARRQVILSILRDEHGGAA